MLSSTAKPSAADNAKLLQDISTISAQTLLDAYEKHCKSDTSSGRTNEAGDDEIAGLLAYPTDTKMSESEARQAYITNLSKAETRMTELRGGLDLASLHFMTVLNPALQLFEAMQACDSVNGCDEEGIDIVLEYGIDLLSRDDPAWPGSTGDEGADAQTGKFEDRLALFVDRLKDWQPTDTGERARKTILEQFARLGSLKSVFTSRL